jgi:hypothetical protein
LALLTGLEDVTCRYGKLRLKSWTLFLCTSLLGYLRIYLAFMHRHKISFNITFLAKSICY